MSAKKRRGRQEPDELDEPKGLKGAEGPPGGSPRYEAIDALRGFAMVWMTVFHFCFDLNNFGHIKQNFYDDPFWTWQRTGILSLFLFTAGFSQSIAVSQGQSWQRFWRRWLQIAACAVLVTAGSYWMFPKTFIYFGVLHGMLVMLIMTRLTVPLGQWIWVLGAMAVLAGWTAGQLTLPPDVADLLNSKSLNWLGWVTHKPYTEDYVPLLPWMGVMWWGAAAGAWAMRSKVRWLGSPRSAPLAWQWLQLWLRRLGQWSLSYYMIHQPLMIGALMGFAWLTRF